MEKNAALSPVIARRGRGYNIFSGGQDYQRFGALPFLLAHVLALGAIWTGVTWQAAVWCAVLYVVRIFAVTAGYHRYFAHRTFKTSRFFQFVLAFLAETSSQKGVLWWASHHRHHHRWSDTEHDVHSPRQHGFWYAHVLWIFDSTEQTDYNSVRDLSRYPELRWLSRHWLLPPVLLGVASYLLFGASGLFFGFFFGTVLVWHSTFTVNSLAHVIGSRRYPTNDDSRNNLFIALITMGEGWHNNHHHYMSSVRQGFFWWEIDCTYYVLKVLSWMGVVWGLREPPASVLVPPTGVEAIEPVAVPGVDLAS